MKQILAMAFLLFGLTAALPCMAGFTAYPGTNVGGIPDGNPGGAAHYGPSRDIYFDVTGANGTVSSVDLFFTATHTFVGDLRVTLIAPNGKRHLIFARTGATTAGGFGYSSDLDGQYEFFSSGNDWWTAVQSNPTVPENLYQTVVSGGEGVSAPAPGTSMSAAFASTPANGRWILRFEDGASGDFGAVSAASLSLDMIGNDRVVSNADDSGAGSLRAAMAAAVDGDHITFASPFFDTSRTINLVTALPIITQTLAIEGPGAHRLTVQRVHDASGDFRIFDIAGGLDGVSLSGMTISNGRAAEAGGGIRSLSRLTLSGMNVTGNRAQGDGGGVLIAPAGGSLVDSSFSGNVSGLDGGAIFMFTDNISANDLSIRNCTISGNHSDGFGGAIYSFSPSIGSTAVIDIVNSTITENTANDNGGGVVVWNQSGATSSQARLRNSIVAGNVPNNLRTQTFPDSGPATVTSQGFNLSDDYNGEMTTLASDLTGDPKLGPLALNGGRTPTRLLLGGSAAIDAGSTSGSALDQRGTARLVCAPPLANGSDCGDIGAVEMQYLMVTNADDAGFGSLRDAITMANANGAELDDILFDPNTFVAPQTINLLTALPNIDSALTISGTGADRLTVTRDNAAADFRILSATSSAAIVALSGMTLSNGKDDFGAGIKGYAPLSITAMRITGNTANTGTVGGGIYQSGSDAVIADSTIDNNVAPSGAAGIAFFGNNNHIMRAINSTISDNAGGGIVNVSGSGVSSMRLVNDTIANNSGGPGLFNIVQGSGTLTLTTLRNTIVAYNSPDNFVANSGVPGQAQFVSLGFNLTDDTDGSVLDQPSDLVDADPALAPLAYNGGPTPTRALGIGSGALDNGDTSGSGVLGDQRGFGFARTVDLPRSNIGDGSDIGAYESQFDPNDVIFSNGFD